VVTRRQKKANHRKRSPSLLALALGLFVSLAVHGEEPKVQRPIPAAGPTSDIQASTETKLQEWDGRLAELRTELKTAVESRRRVLQKAVEDLERRKSEVRSELRDLGVEMDDRIRKAQKEIQSQFLAMEKTLRESRRAE
jgi:hypothetical protein